MDETLQRRLAEFLGADPFLNGLIVEACRSGFLAELVGEFPKGTPTDLNAKAATPFDAVAAVLQKLPAKESADG